MKKIYKNLECLSVDDIKRIHATTLDVLSDVGIKVRSPFGRSLLLDNGCKELENEYISIPPDLVEKCISYNKMFKVSGRDPDKTLEFGNGEVYIHNFGAVASMIDFETGKLHPTDTQDLINAYRLLDKLDSVHLVGPLTTVTEVDTRIVQILSAAIGIQNSTKPVYFTMIDGADAAATIQLLSACVGGMDRLKETPVAILYASPISPLFFNDDCISVIKTAAEAFVPLASLSSPTMGLTAPMSMAGAIILHNAETLAFNVIAKLVNPEEQVVYGARLGFANMMTAMRTSGYPEEGLLGAAFAQLARKYNMVSDVYGLGTRSYNPYDIQQGYEKAICGFQPILAGADMTSGVGHMGSGATTCFETLVIDDEICSMMLKVVQGITTSDEESLAFDVIKEVARSGETFITQEHTVKLLRKGELWSSSLAKDFSFEQWKKQNKPSIADYAHEQVEKLLSEEDDIPAIPAVDEALEKIVRDMGISMDGIRTK
jgi:trimethylamine--corrinoid protein Co-methyltransferase